MMAVMFYLLLSLVLLGFHAVFILAGAGYSLDAGNVICLNMLKTI